MNAPREFGDQIHASANCLDCLPKQQNGMLFGR